MRKGSTHSEEAKQKNAEWHKGRKYSEETKALLSELRTGESNPFYGKHHDPETIEKNRQAHLGKPAWNKGVPMSDEMKKKLSHARKGRKLSEETKRKMSEAHRKNPQRPWLGKSFSEEHRNKLADVNTGPNNHN